MSYDQILSTVGITQSTLETIIIFGLIAVVVGYFVVVAWQFILAGIFIIGILIVFGHHQSTEAKPETNKVEQTEKAKFIEECVSLTQKESMCETLWQERWE
jgi:hypothetical protein